MMAADTHTRMCVYVRGGVHVMNPVTLHLCVCCHHVLACEHGHNMWVHMHRSPSSCDADDHVMMRRRLLLSSAIATPV